MSNMRKILALLLTAAMLFTLTGCFGKQEKDDLPSYRSEEVNLYIAADGGSVVNRSNEPSSEYSLDKDGNIVNSSGNVIVAAANTASYNPVTGITAESARQFPIDLPVNGSGEAQPVSMDIRVAIAPVTATCKEISVSSDNTAVVEVPTALYTIGLGSDSVNVTVTVKAAGTANVVIRSTASEGASLAQTITVTATASGDTTGSGEPGTGTEGSTTTDPSSPTPSPSPAPSASPAPTQKPTPTPNPMPSGTGKTGYISGEGVNFRMGPSSSSEVINSYSTGKKITVYTTSGGWANVVIDGVAGYVYADYISYTAPSPSGTTRTGYISGEGVNFRESPNGDVLDTLSKGTQITVYGEASDGWYWVTVNGKAGYVSSKYVSFTQPSTGGDEYADPDNGSTEGGGDAVVVVPGQ